MKKLNHWFNSLPATRQKQLLLLFAVTFASLLILTLGYNQITLKTGYVPQHIGRTTDTLIKKQSK
jgi:hypothetical protein